MITKCNIARKVAEEGIAVYIANGKREGVLTALVTEPENVVCTCFEPSKDSVSPIKKWIAHSTGFVKGTIFLNEKAVDAVCGEKAVSILPVGVVKVDGTFGRDDLVQVASADGKVLGVGRIACDSEEIKELMGKRGCKPVVHYDYLYLE
jgi:glutamate 5-kinase